MNPSGRGTGKAVPPLSPRRAPHRTQQFGCGDEFRDEFHRLLGKLVHAHATFDFAVGLQLRWLGPHLAIQVDHLIASRRVPFAHRLDALKPLVLDMFEPAGPVARAEFKDWFARANRHKTLRNDYVHGRWGVPGKVVGGQAMLSFVPLHWDMSPDRPDDSIHMTLEDFAEQVDEIVALLHDYQRIEKKYLALTKPSRAM